ncbi:MAG: HAD-IB family hydrolase [Spirochaetaceae bacterium]|nr:HAD-IB family hydrolase [Spirochaetaceae bacterium]
METYIFDIDHTLLKGATGIYFIREGLKRKYFSPFQLLKIPIVLFKYRLGFLKGSIVKREIPFMKGLSIDLVEDLGKGGFENYGSSRIFKEAQDLIKNLQENNKKVIFATSSFDYSVAPVARYFGINDVIASSFEFSKGLCTGYIEGGTAFGETKRDKVLAYLKENDLEIQDCIFYSDSHHDIPLLSIVGKPIAVNPDRTLKLMAKRENWEIIKFKETTGK